MPQQTVKINLISLCTFTLPTLTTNGLLLNGLVYVRGDPALVYTFTGRSADCDYSRSIVPVGANLSLGSTYLTIVEAEPETQTFE